MYLELHQVDIHMSTVAVLSHRVRELCDSVAGRSQPRLNLWEVEDNLPVSSGVKGWRLFRSATPHETLEPQVCTTRNFYATRLCFVKASNVHQENCITYSSHGWFVTSRRGLVPDEALPRPDYLDWGRHRMKSHCPLMDDLPPD